MSEEIWSPRESNLRYPVKLDLSVIIIKTVLFSCLTKRSKLHAGNDIRVEISSYFVWSSSHSFSNGKRFLSSFALDLRVRLFSLLFRFSGQDFFDSSTTTSRLFFVFSVTVSWSSSPKSSFFLFTVGSFEAQIENKRWRNSIKNSALSHERQQWYSDKIFVQDTRVQARVSLLDHEARLLSGGWPEPSSQNSES